MKLLDTTFLIHYWGGVDDAGDYLETHEDEEFLTTTLNLKEIAVGRQLQGKLDRAEILTSFDWLTIVPFDTEQGFVAAELEATLQQRSNINQDRINALAGDLLIAAVAKDRNATVVTENVQDFSLFEGVPVDTYR